MRLVCKITFYGGVNEVGGNKVLVDDSGTRTLLDFGKGFSRRAKFFEEYLKPRSANGLVDFIEMGLIPARYTSTLQTSRTTMR